MAYESAATRTRVSSLTVPALASVGAGAIHAAAMGVHNEHNQAVLAFGILAALQIGWGLVALASDRGWFAIVGGFINAFAVGAFLTAKTTGIGFIDGLEDSEPVQWPDGLAAALAAVAVVGVVVWALRHYTLVSGPITSVAVGVIVGALTLSGMVSAANGHTHGAAGHAHDTTAAGAGVGAAHHPGSDIHVVAKPYDPTKPIDLSGTPGVTLTQQAEAENLISSTLGDLPQWSDPAVAEKQGFHSIGDGLTGIEHLVNLSLLTDGRILDSDHPESLVYSVDRATQKRTLVAAMYMLEPGADLKKLPTFGGPLLQWHIHDNLCFTTGDAPHVAGVVPADAPCPAPLVRGTQAPMVHVWITPHPCGPFAALEGIGGGKIPDGESRLCDHAHGAATAPSA